MVHEVNSVKVVERVASKIAPGPTLSFAEVHVIKALEMIDMKQTIGRKRLSRRLGLGEGVTRTLIRHLELQRVIKISRSGIALSRFGKKVYSDLKLRISNGIEIPKSPLTIGLFNVALLVRSASCVVKYGLEQRDAAIKVGALGTTTLVFSRAKLIMPGVLENVFKENSSISNTLVTKLRPREKDVIIIGSANEKRLAEFGANAAAFDLLKMIQR